MSDERILLTADDLHQLHELERVRVVNTSPYVVDKNDDILRVNASAGAISIVMPFANKGRRVTIIREVGPNNVTITPQSGETINGAASLVISTNYTPVCLKGIKGLGFIGVV